MHWKTMQQQYESSSQIVRGREGWNVRTTAAAAYMSASMFFMFNGMPPGQNVIRRQEKMMASEFYYEFSQSLFN